MTDGKQEGSNVAISLVDVSNQFGDHGDHSQAGQKGDHIHPGKKEAIHQGKGPEGDQRYPQDDI